MKCLLVGGTGIIGRPLAKALLSQGHHIRIVSRNAKKQIDLKSDLPAAEWIVGDLSQREIVKQALENIDIVFHSASSVIPQTSNDNPVYDVESNLVGSLHLLEQARLNGVKKIIFISSGGAVYGVPQKLPIPETHSTEPLSSYGIVKLAIEKYLHLYYYHYGLDYSILRVSNAYGNLSMTHSNFGAINTFVEKALNKQAIEIWGDGTIVRDYIHVEDIVGALVASMSYQGHERVFNIGSGVGVSLNELIALIEQQLSIKLLVNYVKCRAVDIPANILDIHLAKTELGWQPRISVSEGIKLLLHNDSIRKS